MNRFAILICILFLAGLVSPVIAQSGRQGSIQHIPDSEIPASFVKPNPVIQHVPDEAVPASQLRKHSGITHVPDPGFGEMPSEPTVPAVQPKLAPEDKTQPAGDTPAQVLDRRTLKGDNSQPEGEVKGQVIDRSTISGSNTQEGISSSGR